MNVLDFAEKNNVKTSRDGCGDTIIAGRKGSICEGYSDGSLGVYVSFETKRQWNSARRKLQAAGFTIRQDADTEGVAVSRTDFFRH